MLGLPIHGFKRRDWASHAMVYFFSWLAFSIILLNAPFSDHTAPEVGSFVAGTFNSNATVTVPPAGSLACYPGTPGTTLHIPTSANNTLYIIFRATDNVGVRNITVNWRNANVTYRSVAGQANVCKGSAVPTFFQDTYSFNAAYGSGPFLLSVAATDISGLTATSSIMVASP
jgi:hypothetical protein